MNSFHLLFSSHSHSPPGEVGNSTGRVRHDPRGRVPGVSADFNPRWSPAAWFSGRSKASHCRPGQGQCWRSCQRPPHAGGVLAHRRGQQPPPGRGARWRTLVCPGGYPYCWCEIVKERQPLAVFLLYREFPKFVRAGLAHCRASLALPRVCF